MQSYLVRFDELAWQSPASGLRFKACRSAGKQLRLAEFTPEFREAEWCEKGHVGYLLEGILEVRFRSVTVTYRAGDALLIPAGFEHGHKARALTSVARLVLMEDA